MRKGPRRPGWGYKTELSRELIFASLEEMSRREPSWGRALQRRAPMTKSPPWIRREKVEGPRDMVAIAHRDRPDEGPVVLYTHGGGYVIGDPETYVAIAARMIKDGGRAYLPRYRLAPEHRPKEGLDDIEGVYRWLAARHDPARLVVAGDSAGGALTASLCRRMVLGEGPVPRAAYLLSPWADPFWSGDPFEVSRDDILGPGFIDWANAHGVLKESADDPELVLRKGIVEGLPPTLIHDGGAEIFVPQIDIYLEALRAGGVDFEHRRWPEMVHVFALGLGLVPEAKASLDEAAAWIGRQLAG